MVVLNFYGEIAPVCISKKLGLYLANLPNEEDNDWRGELVDELDLAVQVDAIYCQKLGIERPCEIGTLYQKIFVKENIPQTFDKMHYRKIASKMICIYQDYAYEDMPLGGWDTNCFDGRLCEEDYSEKIIDVINFLAHSKNSNYVIPEPIPQWTFSTNYDDIGHARIFWGGKAADQYIPALRKWGEIFDNFLQSRNDYLLFDYLANFLHKDNGYNEIHLMKAYSMCQLFLEKDKEIELDEKLPQFLSLDESETDRKKQAKLFRQMRNKIAHGDFLAFEKLIEEYSGSEMDGHFDYSEMSRKNWTILHVCCVLDNVVRQLVLMMLYDRDKLNQIKNSV